MKGSKRKSRCFQMSPSFSLGFFDLSSCLWDDFSGASRATASGDPASSLRATMGVGAPGRSSAPAPERAAVGSAPATGSATTHRECCGGAEYSPLRDGLCVLCVHPAEDDLL